MKQYLNTHVEYDYDANGKWIGMTHYYIEVDMFTPTRYASDPDPVDTDDEDDNLEVPNDTVENDEGGD